MYRKMRFHKINLPVGCMNSCFCESGGKAFLDLFRKPVIEQWTQEHTDVVPAIT